MRGKVKKEGKDFFLQSKVKKRKHKIASRNEEVYIISQEQK